MKFYEVWVKKTQFAVLNVAIDDNASVDCLKNLSSEAISKLDQVQIESIWTNAAYTVDDVTTSRPNDECEYVDTKKGAENEGVEAGQQRQEVAQRQGVVGLEKSWKRVFGWWHA